MSTILSTHVSCHMRSTPYHSHSTLFHPISNHSWWWWGVLHGAGGLPSCLAHPLSRPCLAVSPTPRLACRLASPPRRDVATLVPSSPGQLGLSPPPRHPPCRRPPVGIGVGAGKGGGGVEGDGDGGWRGGCCGVGVVSSQPPVICRVFSLKSIVILMVSITNQEAKDKKTYQKATIRNAYRRFGRRTCCSCVSSSFFPKKSSK